MSMRDYPMVEDAAFLLDAEIAAYVALASDRADNCVPDSVAALSPSEFAKAARDGSLPEDYYDLDWLEDVEDGCFASAFDGEITTLYPEKAVNPIEECYSDDMIRFIPAARATEMFKMAYASPEELLDEFKENATLSQLGLSEDFDWWGHLVSISGTTVC